MAPLSDDEREAIPRGAPVHSLDGKYLGVVVSLNRHVLVVEQGWFERRGYVVPAGDIARVEGGVVIVARTLAELTDHGRFR